MIVWILIISSWVSLLLLILHDTTKDEGGVESAVSRGTKNFIVALKSRIRSGYEIFHRAQKTARMLKWAPSRTAQLDQSKSLLNGVTIFERDVPIQQDGALATPGRGSLLKRWSRGDTRIAITVPELEHTITDAIRETGPSCEPLVGVIVQPMRPKSRYEPNWTVRGIKFGKADRNAATGALAGVLERMQKEFRVTER
jgi:hypothetical protein